MGLRNALRLTSAAQGGTPGPNALPIGSPWGTTDLAQVVWADLLDADLLPVSRASAMAVPAMARARHLIAGSIASCPLEHIVGADQVLTPPDAATWTYRTDGLVPPWHRMLWTVDDLIFTGWSLWAVDRDAAGHVTDADRVPTELWSWAADGRGVLVDSKPVPADKVVLIPGPHEGVVNFGSRTLRAAARMEDAAARHAANPVPSIELHQEADTGELTQTEVSDLVAAWVAARASDSGAVAFTPYGIKANVLGAVPEQLLLGGRNAAAVDVARLVSAPAASVDATNAGASLTYETTQGRNGQLLDYGVALYLGAIQARLSQDDVLPRGHRVAFDTSNLTDLSRAAVDPGTGPD